METKSQLISNLNKMQKDLKDNSQYYGQCDWDERPNYVMTHVRTNIIEQLCAQLPPRQKLNFEQLKQYLKSFADQAKLSEVERCYFIYYWIGHNIEYDLKTFLSGKNKDCSPDAVLKTGKSVCAGYSDLFKLLVEAVGIECYCIPCFAKGLGFQVGNAIPDKDNHEHNGVKINGGWYLIDSTWGAGSIVNNKFEKSFNDFYFCTDPKEFVITHFPSDKSWQLLSQPVTKEQFSVFPFMDKRFFQLGFLSMTPFACSVTTEKIIDVTFDFIPQLRKRLSMSAHLFLNNKNLPDTCLVQKYDKYFKVRCLLNKKGTYMIHFMASLGDKNKNQYLISTMKVSCPKDQKDKLEFPQMQNYGTLIMESPLLDNIKNGQNVYFKFLSEDAEEIEIVFDDKWIPVNRNANGYFETTVAARGKKISVCEKIGGKTYPRFVFKVHK